MRSEADIRRVFELADLGLNQVEIAECTGVGQRTISKWLRRGEAAVLASPMRQSRDEAGGCSVVDSLPPERYAYLLGQYLGDGTVVVMPNGVQRLEVSSCDDYPAIRQECMDAVAAVMPGRKVSWRRGTGSVAITCYSNHWCCVFPQHGRGMKHTRPIVLEPWQRAIAFDQHPAAFIRGLIHSDGCRCINKVRGANGRRYEYVRYMFSNRSADIRGLFTGACDRLSVPWRPDGSWQVSVARREGTAILEQIVGPKR